MKIIEFKGKTYLFVGDKLEDGGAITDPVSLANFTPGYAHLSRDGSVMHFGQPVGTINDIKVIDEEEIAKKAVELYNKVEKN